MSPIPQPWYPRIPRNHPLQLLERHRAAMPEPPLRLAILDAQRVAPRGAGMPRGIALAGVAAAILMAAGLALCGLAAYGAVALWRALP